MRKYKGEMKMEDEKIQVGYCRVYSALQKKEMDIQERVLIEYLEKTGKPYKIVKNIGSGVYYGNACLWELIRLVKKGKIERIVSLPDRLLSIGLPILITMFRQYGCEITEIQGLEITLDELEDDLKRELLLRRKRQGVWVSSPEELWIRRATPRRCKVEDLAKYVEVLSEFRGDVELSRYVRELKHLIQEGHIMQEKYDYLRIQIPLLLSDKVRGKKVDVNWLIEKLKREMQQA